MRYLSIVPLALAVLSAPVAGAEVRAVLVGVGDYQHLDADLRGPGPDVALMADTLIGRGVGPHRITALTTDPGLVAKGVATSQPTRAAILSAMTSVAEASTPGDTVIFYFSGHGSQSPDRNGDEPGGYDEILLPMDAKGWKGAIGAVENALVDDDLQAWARGLLARGVQVVGMIDACHSGTGFRAVQGQGNARVIDPDTLGIPQADDTSGVSPVVLPPLTGAFLFLYSSQADQRSFEYPLDPGVPDGLWHGAFTLALTQGIAQGGTWSQVLQSARAGMVRGSVRQDPDGEGPLLQAPVFGADPATDRQAVAQGVLQAGLLQGIGTGAQVALYAAPSGGEALAQARVGQVTARTAALDPPPPPGALWAEITMPAPLPPLRLSPAVRADAGDGHAYLPWEEALAMAVADGLAVADRDAPDLVPVLTDGTVALVGADGQLDPQGPGSTPRIALRDGEDVVAATARAVERAAHALRFRGTLEALAGRRAKPGLAMTIERAPGTRTADGGCGAPGEPRPFSGQDAAPCDALWLTLTNQSASPRDVTVFYQSGDFALDPLWPVQGLSNRLLLGESARVGLMIAPDTPRNALEEILVVAVDPGDSGARTDLARLATPDRLRGSPAGIDPATDAIETLLDPDRAMRGFTATPPPLTFLRQSLRITKPEE